MMEETSAAAIEAAPEAIVEAPAGETTEGQVETPPAEGGQPEEKSESAKRREREKAYRARLQTERDEALSRAKAAEAARDKLIENAKSIKLPSEKDFADPFDYSAEKAAAGFERRLMEREANEVGARAAEAVKQAQEIDERERDLIAQSWNAQMEDAKGRYADFEAVALSPQVPITPEVGFLIATSDHGADVAYFLGQNKALAAQIAKMSQVEAARAIGRIEATLQMPKPRTETNAPSPISPVRGSVSASLNPEKLSMEDYIAARKSGKIR
jgi:hypothetical protein